MTRALGAILVFGVAIGLTACTGTALQMKNPVLPNETVIGEVSATATGIMLFNIIPIGQNERFVKAYEKALAQAPGATRLADVSISENWFWAYVLNGYKTMVQGKAVKGQ